MRMVSFRQNESALVSLPVLAIQTSIIQRGPFMKKFLSFFAIALLAATAAKAQTSDAVPIGSMSVEVGVDEVANDGTSLTTRSKIIVGSDVLVLRTSEGQIEYAIKSSDIAITNPDGSVDKVATAQIVTALAEAAVAQGYLYGYTDEATVWSENCIVRSGSGEYTTFAPCSSTTKSCWRDFVVTESPSSFEPTVKLEGSCPDCPGTSYTTVNTVR